MTTRRAGAARAAAVAIAVLSVAIAVLAVAGCGSGGPTGGVPTSSATAVPAVSSAPPSPGSPGSSSPSGSAGGTAAAVEADPGLFAFLPGAGDGLAFTYDPETTAQVASDPSLTRHLVGLAVGLYRPSGATPSDPDFVIANVGRLRDPSVGEEWFRPWRDTYDQAACAPAGGVAGHAEATMAGHLVFIGTCAGGAFTYHVRLGGGAIVVSLTSIGSSRLGQAILERLDP